MGEPLIRDVVFIEGLRIAGVHGVQDHERRIEQGFLVDVRALCDTRRSAETDDIKDTVDYSTFRDIARRVIGGTHHYLIERIAAQIADEILQDTRIAEVSVTIRKPAIFPDGVPGISITRNRL